MRLTVWQVSTLVMASLWTGSFFPHRFAGRPAQAAPQDVHGSPATAVTSYRTQKGSYVLWADGHISNAKTGQHLGKCKTTPISGYTDPQLAGSSSQGSPHVAVAVVPEKDATYVLFANGVVREPEDPGAAERPAGQVTWGVVDASGNVLSGSGDFTVSMASGRQVVIFDKPFTEVPCVTCTATVFGPLRTQAVATRTEVSFNFMVDETNDGARQGPAAMCFVAVGN